MVFDDLFVYGSLLLVILYREPLDRLLFIFGGDGKPGQDKADRR